MGWTTKQWRLVPRMDRGMSSLHTKHTASWSAQRPPQKGWAALALRMKLPGRESFESPPSLARVKNSWSYTSIPPYAFATCTLTALHIICNRLGLSSSKDRNIYSEPYSVECLSISWKSFSLYGLRGVITIENVLNRWINTACIQPSALICF